jgi:hypothetical protein
MEKQYIIDNNRERERLIKLVNEITDKELELIIYKEGWTIAVVLGHLAFWDERRIELLKLWQRNDFSASGIEGTNMHIVNNALVPLFLATPPRRLAELAITTAQRVDKVIEELTDDVVKKIKALNEPTALNRGYHRKMHLDEIDAFLKTKQKVQ